MSTYITAGAVTITPRLVLGYESTREAGNVLHPILGRAAPAVTYRPAQLRTGRMELLFVDEATAVAAEDALAVAESCTLASDVRASIIMTFVLSGTLTRTLDDATRDAWTVAFDWTEVAP